LRRLPREQPHETEGSVTAEPNEPYTQGHDDDERRVGRVEQFQAAEPERARKRKAQRLLRQADADLAADQHAGD